jgi:hypothetical protein
MDVAAPEGINVPAATSTADIMAVFGMIGLVRLEHVGAAVTTRGTREHAAHRNNPGRAVIAFARLSAVQKQKDFNGHIPYLLLGWWIIIRGSIFADIAIVSRIYFSAV